LVALRPCLALIAALSDRLKLGSHRVRRVGEIGRTDKQWCWTQLRKKVEQQDALTAAGGANLKGRAEGGEGVRPSWPGLDFIDGRVLPVVLPVVEDDLEHPVLLPARQRRLGGRPER